MTTSKGVLVGASCTYCSNSAWEVKSMNIQRSAFFEVTDEKIAILASSEQLPSGASRVGPHPTDRRPSWVLAFAPPC